MHALNFKRLFKVSTTNVLTWSISTCIARIYCNIQKDFTPSFLMHTHSKVRHSLFYYILLVPCIAVIISKCLNTSVFDQTLGQENCELQFQAERYSRGTWVKFVWETNGTIISQQRRKILLQ